MARKFDATHRALGTPEILQMILVRLGSQPSISDLLRAQLVCPFWRNLVLASHQLQRRLYLRPEKVRSPKSFDPQDRPRNNLLLKRALQGRYPTLTVNTERIHRKKWNVQNTGSSKRPRDYRPLQPSQNEDTTRWAWDVAISIPANIDRTEFATKASLHHEGATWKHMYLTQPPCKALYLTRGCQRDATPVIERKDGVTMGELVDAVLQCESTWNEGWLGVDGEWHLEGEVRYSCFTDAAA